MGATSRKPGKAWKNPLTLPPWGGVTGPLRSHLFNYIDRVRIRRSTSVFPETHWGDTTAWVSRPCGSVGACPVSEPYPILRPDKTDTRLRPETEAFPRPTCSARTGTFIMRQPARHSPSSRDAHARFPKSGEPTSRSGRNDGPATFGSPLKRRRPRRMAQTFLKIAARNLQRTVGSVPRVVPRMETLDASKRSSLLCRGAGLHLAAPIKRCSASPSRSIHNLCYENEMHRLCIDDAFVTNESAVSIYLHQP
jgi:hypothetical protein